MLLLLLRPVIPNYNLRVSKEKLTGGINNAHMELFSENNNFNTPYTYHRVITILLKKYNTILLGEYERHKVTMKLK